MNKIHFQAASPRTKVPTDIARELYNQVIGIVTIPAIRLVEKHRTKMMALPPQPCSGVFTATMGLPCVHKCINIIQSKSSLTVNDFDAQWYWERPIIQPRDEPTDEPLD